MIQKLLILIGIAFLGMYGYFRVQANARQSELESELFRPRIPHAPDAVPRPSLKEGDLFGRLEIPRLNMSVMVMEGVDDITLRLGAGHIPGTPMAIAGHRDGFFRPLKNIRMDDTIRFTTPDGTSEYHVVSTTVVSPSDTWVLDNENEKQLTLVTCYPFFYIGPAPKRFIVEAVKN